VFNAERYIHASLASVLAQTCDADAVEVIVVDDGSTDGTRDAVLALGGTSGGRVKYLEQANQGPSAARNTGIRSARGTFIGFLDADDGWMPGKIALQIAAMEAHPEIGLLFSDEEEFDEHGVQRPSLLSTSRFYPEIVSGIPIANAYQKLLEENFIPTSTVLARRECFDTVGLFERELQASEDRDMWSRIAAHYPIGAVPQVLGRKRVVASSVSRDVEKTLRSRIVMWNRARRLFPQLAPRRTVNALLAPTYLQLGFVLFEKGNTREARRMAVKSLRLAKTPRAWLGGAGLVFLSCVGKQFGNVVFGISRWLRTGRRSSAASA
jgi:glycosyltransferase involved in cell wall biosynthesis